MIHPAPWAGGREGELSSVETELRQHEGGSRHENAENDDTRAHEDGRGKRGELPTTAGWSGGDPNSEHWIGEKSRLLQLEG